MASQDASQISQDRINNHSRDRRQKRCSASRVKIKPPSKIDHVQNTLQNNCMCDSESSKLARVDHKVSSGPRFNTKALEKLTDTCFAFTAHNLYLNTTLHKTCLSLPNSIKKSKDGREKVPTTGASENFEYFNIIYLVKDVENN